MRSARIADIAAVDLFQFFDISPTGSFEVNLFKEQKAGLGHLVKRVRQTKDGVDIEVESRLAAVCERSVIISGSGIGKPPEVSMVEVAKEMKTAGWRS